MLSTTLQQLIDDGMTTAREIGDLAGVAPSTVYRWVSGRSEPTCTQVRILIRHLPHRAAQTMLLTALTSATAWRFYHVETDLDHNHDGRVTSDDALDATIDMMRCATEAMSGIREATRGKIISPNEASKLIQILAKAIQRCTLTQNVLTHLAEKNTARRIKLAK